MPNGFRGEVVKTYLTKVEEALSIAIEVHSRDPLRGAPTARTGRPFIPAQRNETVPHPADTAHIGGWDTGFGSSRNIVIDETRYREVAIQIANPIEQEFLMELYSMKREIEDVCNSDFTLPQVVVRLRFFLHKLESMFPHSQQLSDDYNTVMMDFARKVLDGSSQLVVWNMDNAKDIQDENDRAITNQANNMEMTISSCESAVVTLKARWDERDFVARTAMKTITNSRGRSRRVPDEARRAEARLDANEIQAQKNALNTTIGELNMEISELQRAKADANRFFTNTENILLSLDRDFGGKARDVKNDICNFTNRLEEMYNDMEYAFDDSFNNRPDFLRWLSENHRDMYLEIIESDASKIIDKLLSGELSLEELFKRLDSNFSSADSWALAKLLIRLEKYGNTDYFLKLITEGFGDGSDASYRVSSIMSFLEIEERRLHHAMIPLNPNHYSVLELQWQAMRISDLRERLSAMGALRHVDVASVRTGHIDAVRGMSPRRYDMNGNPLAINEEIASLRKRLVALGVLRDLDAAPRTTNISAVEGMSPRRYDMNGNPLPVGEKLLDWKDATLARASNVFAEYLIRSTADHIALQEFIGSRDIGYLCEQTIRTFSTINVEAGAFFIGGSYTAGLRGARAVRAIRLAQPKTAQASVSGINVIQAPTNASVRQVYRRHVVQGTGGGTVRDNLLRRVENPKLRNSINEIYRPGGKIGDGGLADAVRHEIKTGQLVGGRSHIQKATERVRNLENIIKNQNLSPSDLEIANKLLRDLKNALGGR